MFPKSLITKQHNSKTPKFKLPNLLKKTWKELKITKLKIAKLWTLNFRNAKLKTLETHSYKKSKTPKIQKFKIIKI
jgi:hypothetical protein